MAYTYDRQVEHLLRRAGFGARPDELGLYRTLSFTAAVDRLINYERVDDDVDTHIEQPGGDYVRLTLRAPARPGDNPFQPNTNITDARQRWLFRMVHTDRPLQEKMTLFWHNHFATSYSKINGMLGAAEATRYMAAKRSDPDSAGVRGQIEMLRDNSLGNFRDILVSVAQDVAMLYWLDGYNNTRGRPQENFARELMELFTMGVGEVGKPTFTESDVYAAARVFTGWNVAPRVQPLTFQYIANNHDTGEKIFTFPIYGNGSKTIPARPAADGVQDGLDLIDALAANPNTGPYLATKLYRFFVSEVGDVDSKWVARIARTYYQSGYNMKAVMREVLLSGEFWDSDHYFARYSWPVEFVVRAIKDIGWNGFSLGTTLTPLANMGQNLFDPPDVAGWDLGTRWFSSGAMLARMNFASALAENQRGNLVKAARPFASTPEGLLAFVLDALKTPALDRPVVDELASYLTATGPWTGTTAQVDRKVTALVHLVAGTPEYQFV